MRRPDGFRSTEMALRSLCNGPTEPSSRPVGNPAPRRWRSDGRAMAPAAGAGPALTPRAGTMHPATARKPYRAAPPRTRHALHGREDAEPGHAGNPARGREATKTILQARRLPGGGGAGVRGRCEGKSPGGVHHPADRAARGARDHRDGRARASLVAGVPPRRTDARHRTIRPAALRRGGRHAGPDPHRRTARRGGAGPDRGGLHDVVLHPDFAHSRLVYIAYAGRNGGRYGTELARGRLDGHRLAGVEVLFRALPKSPRRPSLRRAGGVRRQRTRIPHPR